MIIAQISDTHLLPLTDNDPVALRRAENLQRCVNTINMMPDQPDAVVHTGDMINFSAQNGYGLAGEILSDLKAPFYPTIGNRDSRVDLINQFLLPDIVGSNGSFCQYRVRMKNADLISVDTKSDTLRIGTSCEARIEQLEKLLQHDTSKPVFIFLHHPPAPVKTLKNPLQFESAQHASAFSDLFDRYDNIVRILCGHTHRSDMLQIGKHPASTHPSLATDVRLDDYPSQLVDEPVFQVHELNSDLSVTSMSHFASRRLRAAA